MGDTKISAYTEKTALAAADMVPIYDSVVTDTKKTSIADIITAVGAVFSTWTPTWGGFSANPTGISAYYLQIGKLVFYTLTMTNPGTSNATNFTFTLPVAAKRTVTQYSQSFDNGAWLAGIGIINTTAGSTTATAYTSLTAGAWTNSGTKLIAVTGWYEAN